MGLSRGSAIEVHALSGGIPDVIQSASEEKMETVVLYGKNRKRAMIRSAYIDNNGNVRIDALPYLLKRSGGRWVVVDGEGGPGTYERVAASFRRSTPSPQENSAHRHESIHGARSEVCFERNGLDCFEARDYISSFMAFTKDGGARTGRADTRPATGVPVSIRSHRDREARGKMVREPGSRPNGLPDNGN